MDRERFEKQRAFCEELDKNKKILRQTHIIGHERQENDAEHAWHMAVMAYILREYSNEEIDIAKTMMMILIHDAVEIDAGDTYAYDPDPAVRATQHDRETAGAERIFGMLPEDQAAEMKKLWSEFEKGETPEARFAKTMDNFQPMLLNHANGGQDWIDHGIARSQVEQRNRRTHLGSEEIWEFMRTIIDGHVKDGSLRDA